MTQKAEITNLLRAFMQLLEKLTDEEYQELIQGTGRLTFNASQPRRERISSPSQLSEEEVQAVITHLQQARSRDEARDVFRKDARASLKDNLEQIARMLKIHVNKYDKRDTLEDKIVENVVGVKLRSEAILGLEFNR